MKIDDRKLIENYFKGDEKSLEVLIRFYLKPIYSFIYRYVNNKQEAEDITQEAFLKVWRHLKRFDRDKNFKTWIFTIAKNTSIDFLRTKKKLMSFSERMSQNVKIVIANLSDKYRRVFSLRYEQGFAFRQIAKSLGESVNTIKSRHHRALITLKKLLGNY